MNCKTSLASLLIVWSFAALVHFGSAQRAHAATYTFYTDDTSSFVNMTPTGGTAIGYFISGSILNPDHQFTIDITLSPYTSLVPGNVYEWSPVSYDFNPVPGIAMFTPPNFFTDLPLKNQQPLSPIVNGVNIDDGAAAWMTAQIDAGNLDVLYEFTLTMGDLPNDIDLISGGFLLPASYGFYYSNPDIIRGYTTRFLDTNRNVIDSEMYNLSFGESIIVQLTAFSVDGTPIEPSVSWQAIGEIEAELIPEPSTVVLLLGAFGMSLLARHRLRHKFSAHASLG